MVPAPLPSVLPSRPQRYAPVGVLSVLRLVVSRAGVASGALYYGGPHNQAEKQHERNSSVSLVLLHSCIYKSIDRLGVVPRVFMQKCFGPFFPGSLQVGLGNMVMKSAPEWAE